MKVSKQQSAANRTQILEAASRAFRARGFDGVSVADLMEDAGFTHGGFYCHFSSKEALMAETCDATLAKSLERWKKLAEAGSTGGNSVATIARHYLSSKQRDNPGEGCLIAALSSDVSRREKPIRAAFTKRLRQMIDVLSACTPSRSQAIKREKALAAFSSLVGAMILARAVDDPVLSEEILKSVRKLHGVGDA